MAEHLNQKIDQPMSAFNMMGKPLPYPVLQAGFEHCKQMGLDSARARECVDAVSAQLERDKPYEAQAAGMKFLDLTGTYRLFSVLLTEALAASKEGLS
jgi:hypothetical protein